MHSHRYPKRVQSDGSAMAVASGILGLSGVLLSVVAVGALLGIPAVVLGHLALARLTDSGVRPLALLGVITGYISLAVVPVVLIVMILLSA